MGGLSNLISGVSNAASRPLSQINALTQSLHNSVASVLPPPAREIANWARPNAPTVNLEAFRLPGMPALPSLPKVPGLPATPNFPGVAGGGEHPDLIKLPSIFDVPGGPKRPELPGMDKVPEFDLESLMKFLATPRPLLGLEVKDSASLKMPSEEPKASIVSGAPSLGEPNLPDLPNLPVPPAMPGLPDMASFPGMPSFEEAMRMLTADTTGKSELAETLNTAEIPGTPNLTSARASSAKTTAADAVTLAEMAQDVYSTNANPPAGWRTATPEDLAKLGLTPDQLDVKSANFYARVYTTGEGDNQQFVVSFRGSTNDKRDWTTNGAQAMGLSTPHYNAALAIGRQIAESGATNVVMTGHSLGGGLASAAALAAGTDASTFNAAGLSDATIDAANNIRENAGAGGPGDIRAYYVRGEILSLLQDGGDRIAGSIFGSLIGGPLGGIIGLGADAPEAYGTRIELDPVRPEGANWFQQTPVHKHNMDWVLASLQN